LILIWIFCVPLCVIIPLLIGVCFGIILPYKLLADGFNRMIKRRVRRGRKDKYFASILMFTFALVFFQLLLILSLAIFTVIASIVVVILVALFCPVMLLLIPYYMLRITILSCRTLK
jgi:hypothetical protein